MCQVKQPAKSETELLWNKAKTLKFKQKRVAFRINNDFISPMFCFALLCDLREFNPNPINLLGQMIPLESEWDWNTCSILKPLDPSCPKMKKRDTAVKPMFNR